MFRSTCIAQNAKWLMKELLKAAFHSSDNYTERVPYFENFLFINKNCIVDKRG